MNTVFYMSAIIAVASTAMVIMERKAVHALLYLIVSLLAVAVIFFVLGAPFMAALEVLIYAGAIMVLFVFVMMLLNLGGAAAGQERQWLHARAWSGPGILAAVLLAEVVYVLTCAGWPKPTGGVVEPRQVGAALFGPYVLGVELASLVLLAALLGAYHLGRRAAHEPGGP